MSLIISHLWLVKSNILPLAQFYFQQKSNAKINPSAWREISCRPHILNGYLTESALRNDFGHNYVLDSNRDYARCLKIKDYGCRRRGLTVLRNFVKILIKSSQT